MAVTSSDGETFSSPEMLIQQKNHNLNAISENRITIRKESIGKANRDGCSSQLEFQPQYFGEFFFSPLSTSAWKNFTCSTNRKINIAQIRNNINGIDSYSTTYQYHIAVVDDQTRDAFCKVSSKKAANRHPERRAYLEDKTNDLSSKMEITCKSCQARITPCSKTACSSDSSGTSMLKSRSDSEKSDHGIVQETMQADTGVVKNKSQKCEFLNESKAREESKARARHLYVNASHFNIMRLYSTFVSWMLSSKRLRSPEFSRKSSHCFYVSNFSKLLTFLPLLILMLTTQTNAYYTNGHRHNFPRGTGSRFPRQSGFRRTMARAPFSQRKCEAISVPLCKDIGYNETDMSLSLMNKFTQAEAQSELNLFKPLLKVNCSAELKLLLCSIYTPICMKGYSKFLPPCRFICERAKRGCLPIMEKYEYPWPNNFRCDQFPTYKTRRSMCMHFNLTKTKEEIAKTEREEQESKRTKPPRRKFTTVKPRKTTTSTTLKTTSHINTSAMTPMEKVPKKSKNLTKPVSATTSVPVQLLTGNVSCVPKCQKPMVVISDRNHPLYNKASTGGVLNCAIPCKSPYFTEDEISLAELTIKWFSVACFVVTLMTVTTFLIDMDRFEYPQRPIIFMSICYMFVSIGFLIRIVAGHEAVGCGYKTDHILYHTSGPALCVIVFLLIYFFSMASAIWWVILSMTWFLAAGLKWGNEAIAKYFHVYHIVAWIFPSVLTILVMVLSCVDGDSLSGICSVGNQDVQNLRGFVLFPFVICFALGSLFLLVGFISLIRIRSRFRKDGKKTDKFEKLIGRIGFFNVIYMLSAAFLVACYFYEQQNRPIWEESHNCFSNNGYHGGAKPSFVVLMARHLMTLVIGITNGVWICSSKTLESWKGFYRRCMCCLHGASCPPPCGKDIKKVQKGVDQNGNGDVASSDKRSVDSASRNYTVSAGDKMSDSRFDSLHSRSCSSRAKPEFNSLTINAENSRNSRHSLGSRRTSSGTSKRSACAYCSHSGRSSANPLTQDGQRQKRKRTRSRSRTNSERTSYSQGSRIKRSDVENEPEAGVELCCSNTTSTDSSDRPTYAFPESISANENKPDFASEHIVFSNVVRNTQESTGRCDFAKPKEECCTESHEEYCGSCIDISERYVINCDNLPPPPSHPFSGHSCVSSSVMSHDYDIGNSVTSLSNSGCVDDIDVSLLRQNSDMDFQHHNDVHPYYHHYHHHHFHRKICS